MIYAIKANKLTMEMDINMIHSLVACPMCVHSTIGWLGLHDVVTTIDNSLAFA